MKETYKNTLGLTSQFSFCGLPFRLDTYAGCALSCNYCFARLRGGNLLSNRIRIADPTQIINRFKNAFKHPLTSTGIISELIRNRSPLHFGGMSDPFQPIEKNKKVSYVVLKYLCSIEYPVVISTKSIIVADDEYVNLLKSNPNILVQFSFSTTQDKLSDIVEPSAYAPSKIMRAIEILSKYGIKTSVRWQPFIPGFSEEPAEFVSSFNNIGIKHIGFEHLKLPLEKNNPLWKKLSAKLNYDIRDYYLKNGSTNDGRELILPPEIKIKNALKVKKECASNNITFGSADNEIQYLSDNDCCCSGVDQFDGFENFNKFQISYAIKKSQGNRIKFNLISEEWRPSGSIDKHLNSKSRLSKNDKFNSVEDYIHNRWENLISPFNPSKFYGIKSTHERDDNGFRIFEWDNKIIDLKNELDTEICQK